MFTINQESVRDNIDDYAKKRNVVRRTTISFRVSDILIPSKMKGSGNGPKHPRDGFQTNAHADTRWPFSFRTILPATCADVSGELSRIMVS